jgi:hypothetical protein
MYQALEPKAVRILGPRVSTKNTTSKSPHLLETAGRSARRRPPSKQSRRRSRWRPTARTRRLRVLWQPGCGSSQRNSHCSEARTCRPKYIGKSCRATGESLSGRERIPRTCWAAALAQLQREHTAPNRLQLSAGPQGWPRELYGSLAVVREITAIGYWPKTLGERSVPWADALLAARPRKTRWEEGYDTSKMARSIISSRKY